MSQETLDSIKQQELVQKLSHGTGPPEWPWFFVSESLFEWLLRIDPCPNKCLLSSIHGLIAGDSSSFHALQVLWSLHSGRTRTKGIPCFCGAQQHTQYIIPKPDEPPQSVVGRLLPGQSGVYDFHGGPGSLQWIFHRLQEQSCERRWRAPWAEFPASPSRSLRLRESLKPRSPLVSNVFDERQERLLHRIGVVIDAPWLKLIRHKPPRKQLTELAREWLPFLYRGPVPQDGERRFPPLNTSLSTLLTSADFRSTIMFDLFSEFKDCDVEILVNASKQSSASWEIRRVTGINGLTVVFLAFPGSVSNLLGDWVTGKVIIDDILARPTASLLADDRPTGIATRGCDFRHALLHLFSLASEPRTSFSHQDLIRRVSLFLKAWTCQSNLQALLDQSPLQLLDLLQEMFAITLISIRPGIRGHSWDEEHGIHWVLGPPDVESGLFGIFYGSAVGTVTAIAMERMEHRERRSAKASNRAALATEWIANLIAPISASLSSSGSSPVTEETRAAFTRFFEERLSRANEADVQSLKHMLELVKANVLSLVHSYQNVVDGSHMYAHFCQAFVVSISQGEGISRPNLVTWFNKAERTNDTLSLVPALDTPTAYRYIGRLLYDASTIEVINYPSRYIKTLILDVERQYDSWFRLRMAQSVLPALVQQSTGRQAPTRPRLIQQSRTSSSLLLMGPPESTSESASGVSSDADDLEASPAPSPSSATTTRSVSVVGAARVLGDFRASSVLEVKEGDIVFIVDSPFEGWYAIKHSDGRTGVSLDTAASH